MGSRLPAAATLSVLLALSLLPTAASGSACSAEAEDHAWSGAVRVDDSTLHGGAGLKGRFFGADTAHFPVDAGSASESSLLHYRAAASGWAIVRAHDASGNHYGFVIHGGGTVDAALGQVVAGVDWANVDEVGTSSHPNLVVDWLEVCDERQPATYEGLSEAVMDAMARPSVQSILNRIDTAARHATDGRVRSARNVLDSVDKAIAHYERSGDINAEMGAILHGMVDELDAALDPA